MKAHKYFDILTTIYYIPEAKLEIAVEPTEEFHVRDCPHPPTENDLKRSTEVELNITEVQLITYMNVRRIIREELDGKS